MAKQKVLFITQEINPYLPESPIAVNSRVIPQGIQERGFEVRTFMPKYGCINERRNQLHEVIRLSGMNLIIDDTDHPLIIKVATLQPARMQVYFIDNDDFFVHSPVKELETRLSPEDNDQRSIFFVRGVIETVRKLRWEPAIIHCSGWISALAPLFLKHVYSDDPSFRNSKIIYSLYNDAFEGTLDERMIRILKSNDIDDSLVAALADGNSHEALSRLAMDHADAIVQATADVDSALLDYAEATGKPFLRYDEDTDGAPQRYADFYNRLLDL